MSWLSNLFGGGKNPANSAMPYLNQIPGKTQGFQQPFFDAGKSALGSLQEQYGNIFKDPGGFMNQMGQSYQQSPGFKSAMEQALMAANHAAAAGGMAGSPQSQYEQMQTATGLANQDYNNWLDKTLGLYGQGLSGEQGMAGMGQQAGQSMADMIAQTLAQQGNLAFQGQAQQNQNQKDMFGNIAKGVGAAVGSGNPFAAFTGFNSGMYGGG